MQHTLSKACALVLALLVCVGTTPVHALAVSAEEQPAAAKQQAEIPPAPAIESPSQNSFTIEKSHISAQIQTNASMRASVQNTLQVGDECNVFLWSLSSLNGHSVTSINSVRMAYLNADEAIEGEWITLQSSFFNADLREPLSKVDSAHASLPRDITETFATDRTWMFDSAENMLYAFFPAHASGSAGSDGAYASENGTSRLIIDIDYTAEDAVMAYEDVGEMYWYYLSGGNSMPIWNITAIIQLPVPRGEKIEPGETVVAWGHGAPGTVDVQPDGTIRYEAPYMAPGQYMMAHIIFPISWLENMSRETRQLHAGIRKASAIEGEEDWTDTSASKTANFFGVNAVCVGVCAAGIAIALALYLARGRESNPSEEELREISEMDIERLRQRLYGRVSPTVIARFLRHNNISDADFTLSIAHLIDRGAITVSRDEEDGTAKAYAAAAASNTGAARTAYPRSDVAEKILQQRHAPDQLEGVRLHIGKGAKNEHLQPIERETLKILFDDIADGYPTLPLSDMRRFAKEKPERFAKLMEQWQSMLDEEVESAEVYDASGARLRRGINGAAVLYFVFGIAIGIAFGSPMIALCGAVTAIALLVIASKCAKRTDKGVRLALMQEALERRQQSSMPDDPASDAMSSKARSGAAAMDFPAEAFTKMLEDELAAAYK